VLGAHECAPRLLGEGQRGELVGGGALEDRGADGVDRCGHGRSVGAPARRTHALDAVLREAATIPSDQSVTSTSGATMPGSVIVSTARTPIGKLSGGLASFTAMDLGGHAIKAALERGGVGPEQVDYVIMGHVLQAGQGQITARQAAVKAGIPMTVPAITINK